MKMNALKIEYYKRIHDGFEADDKTKLLIIKLANILDELEPQGDDNLHTIWVSAKRPTFRQFYDYYYEYDYPYLEASKKELKRAKDDYQEAYPYTKEWFRLSVKHFTRNPNEEFYAVFINNDYVFSINDINNRMRYDGSDLIEWAIEESIKVIDAVKKGIYSSQILQNIPFEYRKGKIKRSNLWMACPEIKKNYFKYYKKRDIKKFLKTFDSKEIVGTPIPYMTARIFYEACAVIYKSIGRKNRYQSYPYTANEDEKSHYGNVEQTPKEMYYSNADGRDNGLLNVPMDDPQAFEEWSNKKGPYYEFNGSHPWEIIPSFSVMFSMHLYPEKNEEGYYFYLSGSTELRMPDTIVAANALVDTGYPVSISCYDEISNCLRGEDYVSIIPISEFDFYFGGIQLPKGDEGKAVAQKTIWKVDEYRIKSK